MFAWAGEIASLTWHIVMMYVGICFKKVDYVVIKKSIGDEDGLSDCEHGVEANLESVSETAFLETFGDKGLVKEEVVEKMTEQTDQYRQIIGRTSEGIPIRVM